MKSIPSPKNSVSSPKRSVSSPRHNQTEAKDYPGGIRAANVIGVDPTTVSECPICQAMLSELGNGNGDRLKQAIDTHEENSEELTVTLWLLKHNGPGHLKAHTLQV